MSEMAGTTNKLIMNADVTVLLGMVAMVGEVAAVEPNTNWHQLSAQT